MLRDNAPTIKRVVLTGPAHYVPARGIAAPAFNAFETPLGNIPVDQDALTALDDLPFVIQSGAASGVFGHNQIVAEAL